MSAAQFVWCIVDRVVTPPRGAQLHSAPGDYHFYPVQHDGELTTVDISLWRESSPSSQGMVRQFPTAAEVREAIDTRGAWWTLLASVRSPKARTADPATEVDLQPLPVLPPEFHFVGYDVVDTGALSGLANVGLRAEDLKQIDSLALKAHTSGLLADFETARTLSSAMDELAPEHSPFFPVLVYARRPAQLREDPLRLLQSPRPTPRRSDPQPVQFYDHLTLAETPQLEAVEDAPQAVRKRFCIPGPLDPMRFEIASHFALELREHHGAGYRVYFGRQGNQVVILLCGGTKRSQEGDIRLAKEYWAGWKRRQK